MFHEQARFGVGNRVEAKFLILGLSAEIAHHGLVYFITMTKGVRGGLLRNPRSANRIADDTSRFIPATQEECKVRIGTGNRCWVPRGRYSDPCGQALFAHGSEY